MPIGGIPTEEQIERASQGGRQWDDGEYKVVGLKWYDDENHLSDGQPIYVPNSNGELQAWARLIVEGEEDGPPLSLFPGQILALARVFGVDVDAEKWPDSMKDSSRFLQAVQRAIEKSGKKLKVVVSGGWVSEIPGWSLPRDQTFQFIYDGCYMRDDEGQPCWKDLGYGRTTLLGFRVIGDVHGEKTPYNNWVERLWVAYRASPNPDEPGAPMFVRDENDKDDLNMTRFYNLMMVMCPKLRENDEWGDTSNIMPEWDAFAKEEKVILMGGTIWSKKAGKVKLYYWNLQPCYKDRRSYEGAEELVPVQEEEVIEKSSAIEYVYQAITDEVRKRAGDETAKAFNRDGSLNKAGIAVAKELLTPLVGSKVLPNNQFNTWEDEHCVAALRQGLKRDDLALLAQQGCIDQPTDDGDFPA